MVPENQWLQDEFPFGAKGKCSEAMLVLGGGVVVLAIDDIQIMASETGWWLPNVFLYFICL